MKRREFLALAALTPFTSLPRDYGWSSPTKATKIPRFYNQFPKGRGEGKTALLYKYYQYALNRQITPFFQTGPDCTSNASGLGVEIVEAIQTYLRKDRWVGSVATEILHIGGRSIIGGRLNGGVAIHEAMEFMNTYGILFRDNYGEYDFTKYNYDNCIKMGSQIPANLLKKCKNHQVKTATKVTNWAEARDAIHALQPVVIGSSVGFEPPRGQITLTRDKDGFVKPNGTWYHAWLLIGIQDRGGCLISSHGRNWVNGPKGHNQPEGSIWVGRDLLETMVSKYGDSFAISNLTNLQPKEYKLW